MKDKNKTLNERAVEMARVGKKVKCLYCTYACSPISLRQHWCEKAPNPTLLAADVECTAKSRRLTKEEWTAAMKGGAK